eukprot:CAMPEP_0119008762 /NCGR_PEP_ID=MMETSP1176-20130426/3919_1 /TAXON_ID=265551 /ORGANISM="Synedropsis recta cf, Strain CCMP1620" /LENGTH=894 /DNA_ID=CAMNT_0006961159 /DNA_START=189 /DNA_END=2873 /DNA_ORIENTATION=+
MEDGGGLPSIPVISTPSPTSKTFKTPGFTIPTPMGAYKQKHNHNNINHNSTVEVLVSPGSCCHDNNHDHDNNDTMIDDSAFLPDDFQRTLTQEKENKTASSSSAASQPFVFTKAQVQEQVARERQTWTTTTKQQLRNQVFDELRTEAETQLADHERLWAEEQEQELQHVKETFRLQQTTQKEYYEAQQMDADEKHATETTLLLREQLMALEIANDESTKEAVESCKVSHSKDMEELQQTHAQQLLENEAQLELMQNDKSAAILALTEQLETDAHLFQQEMEQHRQGSSQELADATAKYERKVQEMESVLETEKLALEAEKSELVKQMDLKSTTKLQQLESEKEDATKQVQQMETEKTVLETEKLALEAEKEDATKQVQQMETEKSVLEAANLALEDEKSELVKQMDVKSQDTAKQVQQLESEKLVLVAEKLALEAEKSTLEADKSSLVLQIEQIRKEVSDEKTASDQRMEVKENEVRAQMDELKSKFDVERQEITDRARVARLEVDDLLAKIILVTEKSTVLQKEIDELKTKQLESEEQLNNERTTFKTTEEEMWSKHKTELLKLKEELKEQLEAERKAMDSELHDARANQESQSDREKELLEKLSRLEIASRREKDAFTLRVEGVKQEHTTQIDEMLAQLDMIEAEHTERHSSLEKSMEQKEAIISALGKQLAETTHRRGELEAEHEANTQRLKTTEEELTLSLQGTADLEATVEMLRKEKREAVDTEKRKGQTICDKVRNETIAEAEAQFNKANEHYMTLKHEYDGALGKIAKQEKDLKLIRREVESAKSEGASREAEVAADLAQSRAALATEEATAARKVNEFRTKMEKVQATQRDAQTKLEESNAARHATNLSLATLVSEKEKLIKENKDLNAVCEELMAMVEGGPSTAA